MRYYPDEEDPKKPHPVSALRKDDNVRETQEHHLRRVSPDERRDHHRHVQRC